MASSGSGSGLGFTHSRWTMWEPYIDELRKAMNTRSNQEDLHLHALNSRFLNLYENQLCVSSVDEALAVISGYGCSPLEIAFMWMGRWRPTSAVVLVYSTMGVQINLPEVGKISDGAMDQSPNVSHSLNEKQLSGLSALQEYVSKEEAELSKQLDTIQMLIAEQNAVVALQREEAKVSNKSSSSDMSEFEQIVEDKLKELQCLLHKADNLRLHTLRVLLELLMPRQSASCAVAAYELMLALQSLSKSNPTPEG